VCNICPKYDCIATLIFLSEQGLDLVRIVEAVNTTTAFEVELQAKLSKC
tara:strand:- start:980 stop:1126 length:147 start_codon:yes stop_codon:yes gene_type:complete